MLLHLFRMEFRHESSVGQFCEWMSMSSPSWDAHLKLFMMMFFILVHALCGVVRPLGVIRCLYQPDGRRNVVIFDDSVSSGIWLRLLAMCMVAKHVADSEMSRMILSVMSFASLLMCLLTGDRSMTRSMLPPGFGTKKAWQHHLCGSAAFLILSLFMRSAMWASALAWYLSGVCLVVNAL